MLLSPRKKSGEPLKLSLKPKRTPARGFLTVITDPVGLSSSKNAPTTLAHEDLRLHSQLKHVKPFLTERKPLAVCNSSQVDTSGTESEFLSFIYSHGDNFKDLLLIMHSIDVPATLPLAEDMRDVAVENIELVERQVRVLFVCTISCSNIRKMDCGVLYAR